MFALIIFCAITSMKRLWKELFQIYPKYIDLKNTNVLFNIFVMKLCHLTMTLLQMLTAEVSNCCYFGNGSATREL